MSQVLALLGSAREEGYTARLMAQAVEGMREVRGSKIETANLHDCTLRPCRSCFACISHAERLCALGDDVSGQEFRAALEAYHSKDRQAATDHLTRCGALWTHATWKQSLESDVVGAAPPKMYRPLNSSG